MSEPTPTFTVDRHNGWVEWKGFRLIHTPQFRALAQVFGEAGWVEHIRAMNAAELALTEVAPARLMPSPRDLLIAQLELSAKRPANDQPRETARA